MHIPNTLTIVTESPNIQEKSIQDAYDDYQSKEITRPCSYSFEAKPSDHVNYEQEEGNLYTCSREGTIKNITFLTILPFIVFPLSKDMMKSTQEPSDSPVHITLFGIDYNLGGIDSCSNKERKHCSLGSLHI